MPKDAKRNRYYTIAVPRESRLQRHAEAEHDQTNVAIGQLIVMYATRYVEMLDSGVTPMVAAHVKSEPLQSQVAGVHALVAPQNNVGDDELDLYGEPD